MNLEQLLEKTENVRLVAASKYVGADTIKKFYHKGISEFGENQVKALSEKKRTSKR